MNEWVKYPMGGHMDSIIKTVLDGNWAELKSHFEGKATDKIMQKVAERKVAVLSKVNGVDEEKMREILNVSTEEK